MLSDIELATLQTVARGETMEYDRWPDLLGSLIERLNEIARNEFPILKPPTPVPQIESQATDLSQPSALNELTSFESADKENAPPESAVSNHITESNDVIPGEILVRMNSVIKTLKTNFSTYPPHTIQRLSELIIEPRKHYRNLPAYLHALDRVVNVTSGANAYPLPAAFPVSPALLTNGASNSNAVSWGNSTTAQATLGSDESLGGALLTPIPWLTNGNSESVGSDSRSGSRGPIEREVRTESTETIEGPNGAGSVETVTVSVYGSGIPNQSVHENNSSSTITTLRAEGGVTQGELLRQEQQLNLVPAAQLSGRLSDADGKSEDDEVPHARGPDEVGIQDMGPQTSRSMAEGNGINVEAAIGRRADEAEQEKEKDVRTEETQDAEIVQPQTPKRDAEEELDREAKRIKIDDGGDDTKEEPKEETKEQTKEETKEETKTDEDSEMLLVDEDGKAEGEKKVGEGDGSQVGADAVDTTSI